MSRLSYLPAVALVAVGLFACDALIGTRDLSFESEAEDAGPVGSSDGSVGGRDSSTAHDAGDASTVDGGSTSACAGANLATDPKNCGACGEDCTQGTCTAGLCVLSEKAQAGLSGIALDDANVYAAAEDGTLSRCAKNGCKTTGATFLVDSDQIEPSRVRLVGGAIIFSNYYDSTLFPTGVYQATSAVDGGAARLTPLGQTQVSEFNLGPDASTLFWDNESDPGEGWHSCPLGSCDGGTTTVLEAEVVTYDSLFLPNGAFVWSTDSGVHYCATPPSCGGATVIYDGDKGNGGAVSAIGYDASLNLLFMTTSHYLPDKYPNKLVSCPASGAACTPTPYASNLNIPRGVAAMGGVVYWTEAGSVPQGSTVPMDGTVSKCVVQAGACAGGVKVIATAQAATNRIALDATSVYWTNEGLLNNFGTYGSIMKAAR